MGKGEEERRRATAYNRTVCVPLLSVAPGFRLASRLIILNPLISDYPI
jgi:hypothetical protein